METNEELKLGFSIDWNTAMKEISVDFSAAIPAIGGAISLLLKIFWPASSENIWDAIKDQVKSLVDEAILNKEMEERNAELNGLRDTMTHYTAAKSNEKGALMANLIGKTDDLYEKLTKSSNQIHLIPFTVAASQLHLIILRERLEHGIEMYKEDNTQQWEEELKTMYNNYFEFFKKIYPQWLSWRSSKIVVNCYTDKNPTTIPPFFYWTSHGEVSDQITGEHLSFSKDWLDSAEYFRPACNAHAERMRNQAIAQMAGTLTTTFGLHRYLKGRENDPPIVDENLKVIYQGPYGGSKLDVTDQPGKIIEINVREWNSIDCIQFIYSDHQGHSIGNPGGGAPHSFSATDSKYFNGIKMKFDKGVMCQIELVYSDGTSSGPLGNRGGWSGQDYDSTVDSAYRLSGGSFTKGNGPSGTVGPSAIRLEYRHHSTL
ncbi:insecticidal delta-endotoxin Cry8Ea1 family protein [Cohnella faecalis]|uniref:Pesticidal crystal protein domain-containing protein n=1 Tax=Cohnella faecalis TaxID=2315694 RepID=A0A398CQE0_9BACL|nr:insecticidal delta-endotoxin Cry8Ea1 family protein [Cohnella faecalis]RIE04743.1 hypothetical protein D3H35_04475 [Cohnella faecalis]